MLFHPKSVLKHSYFLSTSLSKEKFYKDDKNFAKSAYKGSKAGTGGKRNNVSRSVFAEIKYKQFLPNLPFFTLLPHMQTNAQHNRLHSGF